MNQSWTRYFPAFFRKRIEGSQILQRIIHNAGWMFVDKVVRLGIGFFVNVWITRYLGPEKFGLLSYAAAFVSLFAAVANLGLYGIMVRDVVRHPEAKDEIVGTALFLKFAGGLCTFVLTFSLICLLRPGETLTHWLVAIVALGMVVQSLEVFDFWFQSQLLSKRTVFANFPGFLIITSAKIILIFAGAPLIAFAWAASLEILLSGVALVISYQLVTKSLARLIVSLACARRLLRDCWPLIFAGLMLMIYNRIDQVMLGQMIDNRSVGVYSAAVKIAEFWHVFPALVLQSMFPAIVEAKKAGETFYYARLQKVFNLMAGMSYVFVIPLFILSKPIIQILYGSAYAESGGILAVYVLSGIFVLLGQTRENWVTVENITRFSLYSTVIGAAVNIILNLIFIPRFGGLGAAYATLIALFVGSYLVNLFHRETRKIFFMQTRSLFLLPALVAARPK